MAHPQSPSSASTLITTMSKRSRHGMEPDNLAIESKTAQIVPPTHQFRTLVLCFDGTGDQFDQDNSNIIKFFSMLKKDDRNQQMAYYQAGIGTYISPQVATPFMAALSKKLDEGVAWNLDAHVMSGYEFLMQNYIAGDRICIFGFSRGAYTARALAVPFAYKMYTRTDETGWSQSTAFKRCFCIDVHIEFIGVWDTVDSVGLIPRRLPFTTSNTIVHTFRHAVSLDEHRAKFKANLWNRPTAQEAKLGTDGEASAAAAAVIDAKNAAPSATNPPPASRSWSSWSRLGRSQPAAPTEDARLDDYERTFELDHKEPTDIQEVWFAGCHCDVGGGSVDNAAPHSLARIPLRWMIRECFKTNTGIMFDADGLRDVGLDPARLYPEVLPRPPPRPTKDLHISTISHDHDARARKAEEDAENAADDDDIEGQEELKDLASPIYDQLSLKWFWWILEILPLRLRYQTTNNEWTSTRRPNMGAPRHIPRQSTQGLRVHRSVKLRMELDHLDGSGKYAPKAGFTIDPTWVD